MGKSLWLNTRKIESRYVLDVLNIFIFIDDSFSKFVNNRDIIRHIYAV